MVERKSFIELEETIVNSFYINKNSRIGNLIVIKSRKDTLQDNRYARMHNQVSMSTLHARLQTSERIKQVYQCKDYVT